MNFFSLKSTPFQVKPSALLRENPNIITVGIGDQKSPPWDSDKTWKYTLGKTLGLKT